MVPAGTTRSVIFLATFPDIVGGLETSHQFIESRQYLFGQRGGDRVLILATVLQNRRQPLFVAQREHAITRQQHVQRREHRPTSDLNHLIHVERGMTAGLATRGIHQPQLPPVGQQADGNLGLSYL